MVSYHERCEHGVPWEEDCADCRAEEEAEAALPDEEFEVADDEDEDDDDLDDEDAEDDDEELEEDEGDDGDDHEDDGIDEPLGGDPSLLQWFGSHPVDPST